MGHFLFYTLGLPYALIIIGLFILLIIYCIRTFCYSQDKDEGTVAAIFLIFLFIQIVLALRD